MTNSRFDALFGGPARKPESRITRREMDLAASVQLVTEEVVLKLVSQVTKLTGSRNLVMAGGVALNCVANGRVWRESGLDGLFIQPAAGDAGGALGAALSVSHQLMDAPRTSIGKSDSLNGSCLGPAFSPHEVAAFLDRQGAAHHRVPDAGQRAKLIADALADGKIVGLMNGRMEFGPRALGSRSILGDPRRADTQSRLNVKIKFRESFRPFAPAVLAEKSAEYFELKGESPYMLIVAPMREDRRIPMAQSVHETDDWLRVLHLPRSDVPAVTHVDYSARVQTVMANGDSELRRILNAFYAKTGCAALVNTSLNVRGEPIVCTPHDAYRCFMRTGMHLLVLEDCLVWKNEQPPAQENQDWRSEYELD
jgi:carbamoyltransferase